ncbi:MAG: hypothetical protein GX484_02365 [Chloroflexi bacterium]|nr:hypothetical protein [Chloroflexota bacterium]
MSRILCLAFLLVALTACGGDDDAPHVDSTPTETATLTAILPVTLAPTTMPTLTPTASPSPTASATPTVTPTLAVRVLEITAVMPGVVLDTAPASEPGALSLDEWVRFEADHPALDYLGGEWIAMWSWSAGQNEYRYSVDPDAAVRLDFEGEGVRVCYVAFWNGGRWEVVIDGQVVGTVDSYSAEAHFTCTDTFPVAAGAHTLLVHNTPQRNAASSDTMLALDAVLTYRANPSAVTWVETLTPSPEPQPARRVELIQGPPTIQPTATPAPPANITVAVLIAYDENANHSVDPAEGVRGIPVRLVDVATNRALAQVFTDESGYARLQVQTNAQVSLVVPYFGQSWDVSRRWGTADATFTLLLPAGNQPGLIP